MCLACQEIFLAITEAFGTAGNISNYPQEDQSFVLEFGSPSNYCRPLDVQLIEIEITNN